MTRMLREFLLREDGAAGMGSSSAGSVNVDSGVAGTSGNPPVTVKQQKKIRRSKIGLIRPIPQL